MPVGTDGDGHCRPLGRQGWSRGDGEVDNASVDLLPIRQPMLRTGLMKVKLKDVHPNPFRSPDLIPLDEHRVEALLSSIGSTGFWANILAREVTGDGVEIAYGHHRLEALRRSLKPDDEVEINVQPLSDDEMVRIMAEENLSEYQHDFGTEAQTIQSVLQAASEGAIVLPAVPAKATREKVRELNRTAGGAVSYTHQTLAEFLGGNWNQQRVYRCLRALSMGGADPLRSDAPIVFAGLSSSMAAEVARAAEAVAKGNRTKEHQVAEELAGRLRAQEPTVKELDREAVRVGRTKPIRRSDLRLLQEGKAEPVPDPEDAELEASELAARFGQEMERIPSALTSTAQRLLGSVDDLSETDIGDVRSVIERSRPLMDVLGDLDRGCVERVTG
jgi:hypothetical protein